MKLPIIHMNGSITKINDQKSIELNRINKEELQRVCRDFESIFIQQMIKVMRKTIVKSGFFGKTIGKDLFESFFDTELSKLISNRDGLGLGKMLYENIIKKIGNRYNVRE